MTYFPVFGLKMNTKVDDPVRGIDGAVREWEKYVLVGLIAVVCWFASRQLNTIEDNQKQGLASGVTTLVEIAAIREQLTARSLELLRQSAQIEEIRAQVIENRMHINTLEQKTGSK